MKRCPTCGNTYTNDGLLFCLEDGARLSSLSNPQSSFDPEATLHIPLEESPLQPTEAARPQGAQTVRQPATPHTAAPRSPHPTNERQAQAAPAAPATPQKSTSPIIVAGITAIVVLLLVIAGIGIALLVRDPSQADSQGNNRASVENNSRADNRETNRGSSNTANDGGAGDSANRTTSNGANRNASSTNASGSAEAKVVRGATLYESDLAALSREELRRLRNAVYARHGRTFDSVDLQRYFDTRPWYRPRADYNEASLTATDLANIKLIQAVENTR